MTQLSRVLIEDKKYVYDISWQFHCEKMCIVNDKYVSIINDMHKAMLLLVVFIMCSDNVKVTLFQSYCSSLYTSQLWWKHRVNSIRKLYVAYNNAFRMLFRLPRDCSASGMFAVNNVTSCPALLRKLVFGFYKRVNSSQNCIVQVICGSDIWWKSSIRSNWSR